MPSREATKRKARNLIAKSEAQRARIEEERDEYPIHPERGLECVFVMPNGDERYEIIFERRELLTFQSMHKAKIAMALGRWEAGAKARFLARRAELQLGEYYHNDQPFTCPDCGRRTEPTADGREKCPYDGMIFMVSEDADEDSDNREEA